MSLTQSIIVQELSKAKLEAIDKGLPVLAKLTTTAVMSRANMIGKRGTVLANLRKLQELGRVKQIGVGYLTCWWEVVA